MAKRYKRQRNEETKFPRLSSVEWAAVRIWLEHRIALQKAALQSWREAAKVSRNPQTIGAVSFHRDALTALECAYSQVIDHVDRLAKSDGFAPIATHPIEVVARN